MGFLQGLDSETGEQWLLDLRGRSSKIASAALASRVAQQEALFNKHGVDLLRVAHGPFCISDIVTFFRRRMRY